ncbi:MAG: DUF349 domain-containing protein [Actinotalea sp.]|nr:DUF349 domain-containing protein [Actinotalea sp.]
MEEDPAQATSAATEGTTEAAVTAPDEPSAEAAGSDDEPVAAEAAEEGATSTQEPVTSVEEPATGTEEPTAGTEEPTTATEEPTAGTEEPATATEEPTAGTEEPATATEEPTAGTEEPAGGAPEAESAAPDVSQESPGEESTDQVPAPGPRPRPVPRPVPRPAAPTPAAVAPAVTAPAAPVPPALTAAETAEAARWGRVDDDGTVWVREESGERVVGQYPDADPTEALAFYVRRYADLHAKVVLFEARLAATDLSVKEIDTTLAHLGEELAEPAAVGDLGTLRARLEALRSVAAERRAAAEAERAAAREAAVAERTAIVEAAEKIAATDPERMQWRPAGEQLRTLLDRWKEAQRHGPRLDRGTEDALWKRFSHARSAFDRERRRWFSELEKRNAGAKAAKEALVAEAERLSSSTDWGATSAAYRDLMTRWKAAGRASRKDDDALWARFRAAQDVFFAGRDASQKQTDAEYSANLEVKLGLLEEAERLVPVTDLAAAKAALREIQDRWERAGKVPRGDIQRVEGRLRAVEQAVRDADDARWRRTNPETRARAEGAAAQLYAAISALEADLDAAKATGDARKVADAQAALDARRAWLEQVERAAQEARG